MFFRNGRNDDDNSETSQDGRARMYDAFSETQTESQVRFYHVQLLLLLSYVFHGK
jgi:hypothetical protein